MKQLKLNLQYLVGLVVASVLTSTAQAAPGRTTGAFNVSATGAATYTIPIWVPPGTRGVQPNLAFVYNSGGGDSSMGPGWALAGLSAISRCNKTVAQDGVAEGVTLTDGDRFCLNGNRLRLTSSNDLNTYGDPGTTYATEIADFSTATATGTAGTGPAYFIVREKDGRTLEFGNGGNSAVLAYGSTTVVTWMLSKVTDRTGNTMVYSYRAQDANLQGATLPALISWTPSAYQSTTYNYTVEFAYQAVSTPVDAGYVAGTPVREAYRMTDAIVKSGSTVVRDYVLGYTASTTTGRAVLTSVKECANAAQTDCLAPTAFTYQPGQSGVGGGTTLVSSGSMLPGARSAFDFNADGRNDLAWKDGGTWRVALGSNSGYGSPIDTGRDGIPEGVTGNGVAGILSNNGGTWWFYTMSGSTFTGVTTGAPVDSAEAHLADVNGDGRPDLVTENADGYLYVRLNTSSNSAPSFDASAIQTVSDTYNFLVTSFNGSGPKKFDFYGGGRQDLVGVTYYCNQWYEIYGETVCYGYAFDYTALHFTGSTFVATGLYTVGLSQDWAVGMDDYNDDGCTDVMAQTGLYVSACNGGTAGVLTTPSGTTPLGSMDWDGDGRHDILVSQQGSSYVGVVLSTGDGLSSTVIDTSIPYSASNSYGGIANPTGDGLDGISVVGAFSPYSIQYHLHNGAGTPPDLLSSVTDGLDMAASPTYVPISQGAYTKTSNAVYPNRDYVGPLYVVSAYTASTGTGTTYQNQYQYAGGWMNLNGYGFGGFQTVTVSDNRPDAPVVTRHFNTAFPLTGFVHQQDVFQHNGTTLISHATSTPTTQTLNSTAGNQRQFVTIGSTAQQDYEVGGAKNGLLITTTSATHTYKSDGTGNLESLATSVTDSDALSPYSGQIWTSSTTRTYAAPDWNNWCFGLPISTTLAKTAPGKPLLDQRIDNTNDAVKCRVKDETIEPQDPLYEVKTEYQYDDDASESQPDFGNLASVIVRPVGMPARTTTLLWADATRPTGQFLIRSTNPLGHVTQRDYDFARGVPLNETDPNALQTSWLYDSFARRQKETRPDGTYTDIAYASCGPADSYCNTSVADVRFHVTTANYAQGGAAINSQHTYSDGADRTRLEDVTGFNGQLVHRRTSYDARGRVIAQTVPYTATAFESTFLYDPVNRVTEARRPIDAGNATLQSTLYAYEGRTTRVTDALGRQTTKIGHVTGILGRSQDPSGYFQNFGYDSFGSLVSVTDSASKTLFTGTYDYGVGAFQRTRFDPDMGLWQYSYTALGEVYSWTDAKGQSFSMQYDLLSRSDSRTAGGITTDWVWGNSAAAHNIGQLASVAIPGSHLESFTFDGFGRLQSREITQPQGGDATPYRFDYGYHPNNGLLDSLTYPISTNSYRLKLKHEYQNGYLQKVSDFNNSSTTFWQANTMNPFGQVTQATLGGSAANLVTNRAFDAVTGWVDSVQSGIGGGTGMQNEGYQFNRVGSLEQRQNNSIAGLTENFYYHSQVHRLDHSTLINPANPGGYTNLSISYADANYPLAGRIASRSDVGNGTAWTYHASKLHALTQAGTGGPSYSYDANGNALTRNATAIVWTPFNKPSDISGNGEVIQLYYNHDHERWRVYYTGPGGSQSTYFIGGLLEKVIEVGGETDYRHLVYAGGEQVAIVSRESNGTNKTWYLLSDHLGSLVGVVDETGTLQVKTSYGAYGLTRSSCTWDKSMTGGAQSKLEDISGHGYTWHTTLGKLGLIDMQGRIQDAVTGRFLSPDPFITEPGNTQNFDRYAYTYNDPLSYTDPSGFSRRCYGDNEGTCDLMDQNPIIPWHLFFNPFPQPNLAAEWQRILEFLGLQTAGADGGGTNPAKDTKPVQVRRAVQWLTRSHGTVTRPVYCDSYTGLCATDASGSVMTYQVEDTILERIALAASIIPPMRFGAIGTVAARAGAQSFRSFSSLKNALGPAGPAKHWHHVVEQTPGNVGRFGAEAVHNTGNVMRLDAAVHGRVSGFYSSIQPQVTGSASMTVRQWMSAQSFEAQQTFGQQVLRQFGGL